MDAHQTEIILLSKSEQTFLFKSIARSIKKWKRKQLRKLKRHTEFLNMK